TEGTDYTVSYKNNTDVGTATVTITGKGNYTGTKDSDFTINPASIEDAEVSGLEDKTYNGKQQEQTLVVKVGSVTLENKKDYTVSYDNNTNVGTATATITGTGNYTGELPAKEFTINPASIKDADVTGLEDKTYNGEEQKQAPVVKLGSTVLTEGTDYTVSYSDNVNAGKATLTITGKGNYTGTKDSDFTINPASIEDAEVSGLEDKTYNGEEQKQTPVVKVASATLTEGTDYTVSYKNNTNAGTATMTITGKGNYTGTKDSDFTINPASIEGALVADIDDMAYTGSELKPKVTVTLEGTALVKDTDFTVDYSNNTEKGTATATITGIGNYTGTVEKNFTITDKISIETAEVEAITGLVYNGKEQKPTPVVKINSTPLKEGTDYTIDSYSNNTNAGTATMTITGKGGYFNSKTIEFTINPAPISSASISGIANKTYNGKAQAQTPVVTFGSATLKEKTDYTVSYKNNTNAGTATVTFTAVAKSNFTGTVNKTFTISKAAQSFTVRAAAAAINVGNTTRVTASGAKENPKYTFTSSNARIATVNTAGTVTGKAAGTVTITVNAAATANYNALSKTVNITVNKVLKRPGYCHFIKWNNSKYTSCRIGWRKVDGADGYQTYLCWTNGSHASTTIVKSNVLYRNCTVHPQHVSQMKVRAFYMQNGQRKFGPWSNIEYITPSPTKLTTRNVGTKNSPKIKASWNIIYGCNGYNVFITTNPNGKWYWNQSTSQKATSTSAVIDKCGGAKLKKNTRYYVRLVTRRKRHGVFCTVPMPASNTYVGSFIIK
ncbi:MAG: Ig-like domain-containing protein, partial [Lachnospiraceae bacterium]|nr:Ig-like domain-containing protein [Lachnospiraceae bacterium]